MNASLLPPLTAIRDFKWTTGNQHGIEHVRRIDAGAVGEVHEMVNRIAFRKEDNELRAIKKICISTEHAPNIVRVLRHNFLPNSHYYFIDMELCQLNLDSYIQMNWQDAPRFPSSRYFAFPNSIHILTVWSVMADITRGLFFIHSVGEVHRDLKPRNVLYHAKTDMWKIADFGITSEGTSNRHSTTSAQGTPSYRAPELLAEDPSFTRRTDIFSLGCILYELVTGAKVFPSDWAVKEFEAARRQISIPPSPRVSTILPDDEARNVMVATIRSMLELEPRQRPSSEEMKNKFSRLAAPRVTSFRDGESQDVHIQNFNDQKIDIIIKTANGRTDTLTVRHSDRILDILSELEVPESHEERCLIYQGQILHKDNSVHYYNIRHGDVIYDSRKPKSSSVLFIKTINGKTISINWVHPSFTIYEIKAHIHERTGVPHENQVLVHRQHPLDDQGTLGQYNIGHESVIYLMQVTKSALRYNPSTLSCKMLNIDGCRMEEIGDCDW